MITETVIEVFNDPKYVPYTYQPSIYGDYKMKTYTVNGRPYFKKSSFQRQQQEYGIWWSINYWMIGFHINRGKPVGFAMLSEDVLYPHLARQENKFLAYANATVSSQIGPATWFSAGNLLELRCKQARDCVQMNILSGKLILFLQLGPMEFMKLKCKIIWDTF